MKKISSGVLTLLFGIILAFSTSSFTRFDKLYGNDSGNWIDIAEEGLVPAVDPMDLQPGEYACEESVEPVCTASFAGAPGSGGTIEEDGTFIYELP